MSNVESAAAAGDNYNLRSVLLADGTGAIVGSALGSPFPPAVYIGHPGWKKAGGRTGYSMATGVVIALLCFLGLFGLLGAIFPLPAIVPILLYIGLLIGAQAFQFRPEAHAAAVIAALIPEHRAVGHRADRQRPGGGRHQRGATVGDAALEGAGVIYDGLQHARPGRDPGRPGARRDRRVHHRQTLHPRRGVFALVGGAARLRRADPRARRSAWNANGPVALGYLCIAVVCGCSR